MRHGTEQDEDVPDGMEVAATIVGKEIRAGSVETPHMALKNFDRIALRAGESRTVTFDLRHDDLALYNLKMEHVVEPGEFKVMVGAASNDIRLEGSFRIK